MRYFIDMEYNGFGGDPISLALVPQDETATPFYEVLAYADPHSWVITHVIPVLQKLPISRAEMIDRLATYLQIDPELMVTANWPGDIANLTLLMITGPGCRTPLPRMIIELVDLPLFDSATLSRVPHNAYHDAVALREYILANAQ